MASGPNHRERIPAFLPTWTEREDADEAAPTPWKIWGLELSLGTAPLDVLETASRIVTPTWLARTFDRRKRTAEAVLLSTCHRVELFLLAKGAEEAERWAGDLPGGEACWTAREGEEAVRHLFRVAAGLESLARGETEVRQQVRAARSRALSRHNLPVLRTLLDAAVTAAEELGDPAPRAASVADVAVARLRILRDLGGAHVLVVGTGTVAREVVRALGPEVVLTVAYHSKPPERAGLPPGRASSVPLERLREVLPSCDVIVTAAKFGDRGLHAADLPRDRPLIVLDLGVPRNVEPSARELPNVRLVDLEELYRLRPLPTMDGGVDLDLRDRAERTYSRMQPWLLEPWVGAIRRAAEEIRQAEIARAREFLGPLDPHQELALERLTQRLVTRLVAAPTEKLRAYPDGPDGDRQRRLALDLLSSSAADP